MFWSLSDSLSYSFLYAGPLSDEYYDVLPELENLIPVYPSMTEPVVSLREEDYLSDSDDSFASASETLNFRVFLTLVLSSPFVLSCNTIPLQSVLSTSHRVKETSCTSQLWFLLVMVMSSVER